MELNLYSLEVVAGYRDPQLQVSENNLHDKMYNLNHNICQSARFNALFFF